MDIDRYFYHSHSAKYALDSMNTVSLYRRVLKQLSKATLERPHYVQDIRFLLSLPLMPLSSGDDLTNDEAGTIAPSSGVSSGTPIDQPPSASLVSMEYLRRPPSQCTQLNSKALFSLCCEDLRAAMKRPLCPLPASTSLSSRASMSEIALQVLRYRDLLWLQRRLERVLSAETRSALAVSLGVVEGPTSDGDFIPDRVLETMLCAAEVVPLDSTTAASATASPAGLSAANALQGGKNNNAAKSSSSDAAEMPSGAANEWNPNLAFSAGAIGQQREMFVLRHREEFHMLSSFLFGFPNICREELEACRNNQAAIVTLAQKRIPSSLSCHNEDIRLSVSVSPFDAAYTTKEHAGAGYFATAHRQFYVSFSLEPLSAHVSSKEDVVQGGNDRIRIQVVNSYFARVDLSSLQLIEEVGYVDSSDVLWMLNDHLRSGRRVPLSESEVAAALDEPIPGSSWPSSMPPVEGHVNGRERGLRSHRQFQLLFTNPSDAATVLKGILHYKIALQGELHDAPIRVIPFGFLLLNS